MSLSPSVPSRRGVLRAAAWTVPAVTVAAATPAFAASSPFAACTVTHALVINAAQGIPTVTDNDRAVVWSTSPVPVVAGGLQDPVSSVETVAVSIDTSMVTGYFQGTGSNGHFLVTNLAQTGAAPMAVGTALKFATRQVANTAAATEMRIVLRFSAPVRNLRFTLTDIDDNGTSNSQRDQVWVESMDGATPAFTFQRAASSVVTGSGTASAPWGTSGATGNVGNNETRGNVLVTTASGLEFEEMELRFKNVASSSSARSNTINIGNISFETEQSVCVA